MDRQPITEPLDETLEAWDQSVTAVRYLARGARPGLTVDEATAVALTGWVNEQAAFTNADQPFVRDDRRHR